MRTERQLVSLDWAMKKLLRSKANYAILEGFLSELLFDDITIKEILESEGNQENQLDKFNRVDIMKLPKKEQIQYKKYIEARIHDLSEAETIKQDLEFAKKEGIEQERRVQEERRKSDKIKTAKKMLLKKFDIETISELTGLSIKEIQKLS